MLFSKRLATGLEQRDIRGTCQSYDYRIACTVDMSIHSANLCMELQ